MGVRSAGQARGKSKTGWSAVDGCQLAWEQAPASGRPRQAVVCLHAAGSGSREFRPLFERIPTGTSLMSFDWPSHGRSGQQSSHSDSPGFGLTVESGAAMVQNLLQQWGVEHPILLGSGFGAAVAIRFAADHPGRAAGLILCQPAGLVPSATSGPFSRTSKLGIRTLLRVAARFAPASAAPHADAEAAKRQILRLAALSQPMQAIRTAAKASLDRSAVSLRTALESLRCPALFALSRHNREFPLRRYLALLDPSLAWAPQHQFTVFAGAFHPLWDEPERFAQAVTGFVQAQLPLENHTHAWLISAVDYPTRNMNTWKCVHPDCGEERLLPVGRNPNESPKR
jgi:pimeloyl-ACP methyl ester carboxylesterase